MPATERDHEAEWKAAEEASLVVEKLGSPAWRDYSSEFAGHQPKFTDRPHPDSYGAKLPMRGLGLGDSKRTHKWSLTVAEKKHVAARTAAPIVGKAGTVRKDAPHPDSYGAELPLRGGGCRHPGGQKYKWALTAAEKAALAGRPLRYTLSNN
jgi:hypothetical protein